MADQVWDHLLAEVRTLFDREEILRDFCTIPDNLTCQDVTPHHIPAAELLEQDPGLFSKDYSDLRDAFIAASPHAQWRETYKGTALGSDFMDRFACYCLIGAGGPFLSDQMGAYVVYMPPGLYYPYHHHPAEELYFILAGEADFLLDGTRKTCRAGDGIFHPTNAPHATETRDHPFMALVLWRGDLQTKPVLTNPGGFP